MNSKSSQGITFRLTSLGKVITPLSPHQLLDKLYHYCSSIRMVLVLNNPWRLIYHSTKKSNHSSRTMIISNEFIWNRIQITKGTLKFIDWKVHMLTLYLLWMTFLTNWIQALQHWSKKDNIVSAMDDFFDQLNPSTTTLIEEGCWPEGHNVKKFHENILVSLWIFQPALIYVYLLWAKNIEKCYEY